MKIKVYPSVLTGTIDAVPSKSLSHRALIAAGLATGKSQLFKLLEAEDIKATKNALLTLGVKLNKTSITGGNLHVNHDVIDAKESGSTLRFMIPIALLLSQAVTFIGHGKLPERPLGVYEDLFLEAFHYNNPPKTLPLTVKGPLKAGTYKVRGDVSSQFISGLLFALPLCQGNSIIKLTSSLQSKDYVSMTIDVLKRANVTIIENDEEFIIPGNQSYQPFSMTIEGDYSQAAFFLVAGCISQTIAVRNLSSQSKQGDRAIVDILKAMNGTIVYDGDFTYRTSPSQTKGTLIDLKDIPDLGPILMVLAALSEGTTNFKNTERLKLKESDRLEAMITILKQFGVPITLKSDTLSIQGVGSLKGNQSFSGYNDHRIVMALSIAALKADGPIIIEGAEAINKSYPSFFDDYKSLGGTIEINQ